MSLDLITKENLHHSNLIISGEDVLDEVLSFVESLNVKTFGNENFIFEKFDKFLIDDARRIFDIHLRKTPEGELQVFVLSFNFITIEAQNALLKMFEEPKERTVFFIISPNKNIFLETILSRVNLIDSKVYNLTSKASKFLKMNIGERMKFISDLTKDIKGEKAVKQDAINLLSQLEVEIERKGISEEGSEIYNSLKTIILARKYINLNGASVKILLENVALHI